MSDQPNSASLAAVAVGFLLGSVSAGGCEARRMQRAKEGWNLIPAAVATQAIKAGTPLSSGMHAAGEVPEQFGTPTLVKPDQVSRFDGQPLLFDVIQGQLLSTQMFPSSWTVARCEVLCQAQRKIDANGTKPR
jgi:hypothetical protein